MNPQTETKKIVMTSENLSLNYGETRVISQVNLTVYGGEILALLGANGCGKSTLLKGLARRLHPTQGSINLAQESKTHAGNTNQNQANIWTVTAGQFAKKVAYVPQSILIPDEMTVMDLAALGRNPHQRWWQSALSKIEEEKILAILKSMDILHLKDKALGKLSGGERQRAVIAMALCQSPELLLMDEPTTGMDFRHQLEILNVLKDLRSSGLAIVVVLHDLNLTARIADKVALLASGLKEGKSLMAYGPPEDVLNKELLQCAFAVNVESCLNEKGDRIYYFEPL